MSIIKFTYSGSKEAITNGTKTSTLRDWKERHAKQFHKGDIVHAWDGHPLLGGKCFALIRVTRDPYEFMLKHLDRDKLTKEGHPDMTAREFIDAYFPKTPIEKPLTCLEFEAVAKFVSAVGEKLEMPLQIP